jgi:hypothetical protein
MASRRPPDPARPWFTGPIGLGLGAATIALIVVGVVLAAGSGGDGSPGTVADPTSDVGGANSITAPSSTSGPAPSTAATASTSSSDAVTTAGACTPKPAVYGTGPFTAYGDLVRGLGDTIIGDRMVITNFLDLTFPTDGGSAQGAFVVSLLGPNSDDFTQHSGSLGPSPASNDVSYDPATGRLSGAVEVFSSTDPSGGGTAESATLEARYDPATDTITGSIAHSLEPLDFVLATEPGVMFDDPACATE